MGLGVRGRVRVRVRVEVRVLLAHRAELCRVVHLEDALQPLALPVCERRLARSRPARRTRSGGGLGAGSGGVDRGHPVEDDDDVLEAAVGGEAPARVRMVARDLHGLGLGLGLGLGVRVGVRVGARVRVRVS